jgi:alpha-amylase/alpha-mannosidase (GH57 family)
MIKRSICVHGHFYQPPRENPSLEYVESQDSAQPYHDWNERITAECYAPNGAARILDAENRIAKIINNYAHISFNFGPTLLSWLEEKAPGAYRAIVEADVQSAQNFAGHGSAIAQAYNHMILPLANSPDKRTQVRWGLRDFKHRFRREPEGMWLPETAVDVQTLEILAEHRIKYTILAPRQASRVRKIGSRSWKDVSRERIDPTRPYLVRLPSRRKITVFFYDGTISRAVAFEGLLSNGEQFATRLISGFSDERDWPQLMHIATDGESYGHHHHFGEMALAYALDYIESKELATITNYGEFLANNPPTHQVEIFEKSSWSCVHGVERWLSDCGCNSGGHSDWSQQWRAPLRAALDWLRDALASFFEVRGSELLKEVWLARDEYIDVILDRSEASVRCFLEKHGRWELNPAQRVTALKLLEMQRHAMLMYTSCGWFFDELSGIETVQVMHYAGRAVQLATEISGNGELETGFLSRLVEAKSNLSEHGNGADIYRKFVKPAIVDMPKLAAHYAIRSTFERYEDHAQIYSYMVDREECQTAEAGKLKLVMGRARFVSRITEESARLEFCVLNLGDHNVNAGVHALLDDQTHAAITGRITEAFERGDTTEALRLLDAGFDHRLYSLRSLFHDDQKNILSLVMRATLSEVEMLIRQKYAELAPLIRFVADLRLEQPKILRSVAELALNSELHEALAAGEGQRERAQKLAASATSLNITLDTANHEYLLRRQLEQLAERFAAEPPDLDRLRSLRSAVEFAGSLPFSLNLWELQNLYAQKLNKVLPDLRRLADQGDDGAKEWLMQATALAEGLRLRMD